MRTSSDPGQAFLKQQLRGASLPGLSEHSSSLQELLEQSTSLQGLLGHSISLEGLLEQFGAQGPADEKFGVGVQVRVDSEEQKVITLQRNSGGWNSKMKEYLGKTGIIKGTVRNIVVVQFSDGKTWAYNKKLLQPCEVITEPEEKQNRTFKR
ncbi:hypothetical protein LSAT2_020638 [Lamellibrachia satsuma]|nr:hypothetical protein LSAT2_020638 [Lamellibrachia satsuma]